MQFSYGSDDNVEQFKYDYKFINDKINGKEDDFYDFVLKNIIDTKEKSVIETTGLILSTINAILQLSMNFFISSGSLICTNTYQKIGMRHIWLPLQKILEEEYITIVSKKSKMWWNQKKLSLSLSQYHIHHRNTHYYIYLVGKQFYVAQAILQTIQDLYFRWRTRRGNCCKEYD